MTSRLPRSPHRAAPADRALALALALTAAAGCGVLRPAPPALGPERVDVQLTDAEITDIARLLRYEDHRAYDAAAFADIVDGAGEEVRRRAATAAGRIGDLAAAPFLLHVLETDPLPSVRADAAFALGLLGDSSAAGITALEDAVPEGWAPTDRSETAVVVEVVAALGRIGGDRARDLVRDALRESRAAQDAWQRQVAGEALLTVWKFGDGPGNVQAAAPYLEAADPELRWRAAYALMRGLDPGALDHLLTHGEDNDHRVRAYSARALTSRAADSAGVTDAALQQLTRAIHDPHPHVQVNALRSLGGYGERVPIPAIRELLRDAEPGVAVAAATALGEAGPSALPVLSEAAVDTTVPPGVRGAILEQVARLSPDDALPVLRQWATGDSAHRYLAARAAAFLPLESALRLVSPLVDDSDARVATAALTTAAGSGADDDAPAAIRAAVRALLLAGIAADDPIRRAAAAHLLIERVEPQDAGALVASFRRSRTDLDTNPAVRGVARDAAVSSLLALDKLTDLGGSVAGVGAAIRDLFSDPSPADRWIRRAAADVGRGWGGAPGAVAAEDVEFYEHIVRHYIARPLAGNARPRAVIETPHGRITLALAAEEAPLTVHSFVTLAGEGFFDGGTWHRVIPNFVLQDGAPGGYPSGGPGWTIRDEINRLRYDRGVLGMALSGPDTGGSQWFITHSPQPHLDGGYTVFGRVVAGMSAADAVVQGDPVHSISVTP
jgi:cyclophilin family peptidyl-prolyl cis-trans isomerase/HEAT repeat protein